jgi:hypothetical protein
LDSHLKDELAPDMGKSGPADTAGGDDAGHQAMPTGSFAPASPSKMVPLRPEISRCPSTENTTAGSVGATRGSDQQCHKPSQVEGKMNKDSPGCHGEEGAGHTHHRDRGCRRPQPRPANVHPPVEQDAHECDSDNPLCRLFRRGVEGGNDLDGDGGKDQKQRR